MGPGNAVSAQAASPQWQLWGVTSPAKEALIFSGQRAIAGTDGPQHHALLKCSTTQNQTWAFSYYIRLPPLFWQTYSVPAPAPPPAHAHAPAPAPPPAPAPTPAVDHANEWLFLKHSSHVALCSAPAFTSSSTWPQPVFPPQPWSALASRPALPFHRWTSPSPQANAFSLF